jgi:hypothetical protein
MLRIAAGMGVLELGVVSLDGTRIKANASKHSALSYGRIKQLEVQIQAEIDELKRCAEAADDLSLPEELQRREDRLAAIGKAKAEIEARAAERDAPAKAEYEAKVKRRDAQRSEGKKPRGREPQPPPIGPLDKDQINLTDAQSRVMPVSGGGFEQGYNAQAAVDATAMLIVAHACVQAPNDKQQVTPMLAPLAALPQQVGLSADTAVTLAADTGYFSQANGEACEQADIVPLIASQRESHSGWLDRQLAPAPKLPEHPTAVDRMRQLLATPAGRAAYALRKCTVEPVFGIIKQMMGFRQFMVRGLRKVQGEWGLVCLAFNIKRLAVLNG